VEVKASSAFLQPQYDCLAADLVLFYSRLFNSLQLTINSHRVNELSVANSITTSVHSDTTALQYMQRQGTYSLKPKYLSGFYVLSKQWIPPWLQKLVEIDFNISSFDAGRTIRYHQTSLRLRLPFLLPCYMWCFDLIFLSRFSYRIPFEFQSISTRHIVPGDSEIFKACQRGDSLRVWELLVTGKAHWRDTTPDNSSLLRVSKLRFK